MCLSVHSLCMGILPVHHFPCASPCFCLSSHACTVHAMHCLSSHACTGHAMHCLSSHACTVYAMPCLSSHACTVSAMQPICHLSGAVVASGVFLSQVLRDVNLVFSGIGHEQRPRLQELAKIFGASVSPAVTNDTTHVVAKIDTNNGPAGGQNQMVCILLVSALPLLHTLHTPVLCTADRLQTTGCCCFATCGSQSSPACAGLSHQQGLRPLSVYTLICMATSLARFHVRCASAARSVAATKSIVIIVVTDLSVIHLLLLDLQAPQLRHAMGKTPRSKLLPGGQCLGLLAGSGMALCRSCHSRMQQDHTADLPKLSGATLTCRCRSATASCPLDNIILFLTVLSCHLGSWSLRPPITHCGLPSPRAAPHHPTWPSITPHGPPLPHTTLHHPCAPPHHPTRPSITLAPPPITPHSPPSPLWPFITPCGPPSPLVALRHPCGPPSPHTALHHPTRPSITPHGPPSPPAPLLASIFV